MAQLILERFTYCPTGKKEDEIFFEVVIEDDSPLDRKDKTPRTTQVKRIFTRGNIATLRGASVSPSPAEYTNKYSTVGNTYEDKYESTL